MRILTVLTVSSLALLVACDNKSETKTTAPASTTAPAASSGATTTTAAELAVGKSAPDFTAKAQDGTDVTLSKLKGKPVVVYFYPKDETKGCTIEAESFRDSWKDLSAKGAVVIGISRDNDDSHKAFAKNHQLPFLLVSDESGAIAKAFGVPNTNGYLARQTIVIGADGNIKKIYRDVDPSKHAADILTDVGS